MTCIKCKREILGPYFAIYADRKHGFEWWHMCHVCLCEVMLNLANSSEDRHLAFMNIMRGYAEAGRAEEARKP